MDRAEKIAAETARYAIDTVQQAWPETNGPLLRLVTDAIAAALRSYAEPPKGWRLVPEEPTEGMAEAGWTNASISGDEVEDVYRAMLAAAPPPTPGD